MKRKTKKENIQVEIAKKLAFMQLENFKPKREEKNKKKGVLDRKRKHKKRIE